MFESTFQHLHSRKCVWKCRLPKWRAFRPGGRSVSSISILRLGAVYALFNGPGKVSFHARTVCIIHVGVFSFVHYFLHFFPMALKNSSDTAHRSGVGVFNFPFMAIGNLIFHKPWMKFRPHHQWCPWLPWYIISVLTAAADWWLSTRLQ